MESTWIKHHCKNKGLSKTDKSIKNLPKNVEKYLNTNLKFRNRKIYRGYSFKTIQALKKWQKNELVSGKIGKKENIKINIKNISSWTYSATNTNMLLFYL